MLYFTLLLVFLLPRFSFIQAIIDGLSSLCSVCYCLDWMRWQTYRVEHHMQSLPHCVCVCRVVSSSKKGCPSSTSMLIRLTPTWYDGCCSTRSAGLLIALLYHSTRSSGSSSLVRRASVSVSSSSFELEVANTNETQNNIERTIHVTLPINDIGYGIDNDGKKGKLLLSNHLCYFHPLYFYCTIICDADVDCYQPLRLIVIVIVVLQYRCCGVWVFVNSCSHSCGIHTSSIIVVVAKPKSWQRSQRCHIRWELVTQSSEKNREFIYYWTIEAWRECFTGLEVWSILCECFSTIKLFSTVAVTASLSVRLRVPDTRSIWIFYALEK